RASRGGPGRRRRRRGCASARWEDLSRLRALLHGDRECDVDGELGAMERDRDLAGTRDHRALRQRLFQQRDHVVAAADRVEAIRSPANLLRACAAVEDQHGSIDRLFAWIDFAVAVDIVNDTASYRSERNQAEGHAAGRAAIE